VYSLPEIHTERERERERERGERERERVFRYVDAVCFFTLGCAEKKMTLSATK